jgi:hypothetical protein
MDHDRLACITRHPDIPRLKRLFECFGGDVSFRRAALAGDIGLDEARLRRINAWFAPADVAFLAGMADVYDMANIEPCMLPCIQAEARRFPLLALWLAVTGQSEESEQAGDAAEQPLAPLVFGNNPGLTAWRRRRASAVLSELGAAVQDSAAPVVSIELSDGCSRGCWFCAFAVKPLHKTAHYPTHGPVFRRIVQDCMELIGPEAAPLITLYHDTEPHDAPGYILFMEDYRRIAGSAPFTSTVVGHDADWVDRLLAFYANTPGTNLRINVLSTGTLRSLHDRYSPQDLVNVELAMKIREVGSPLVASGRILNHNPDPARAPQCTDLRFLPEGADPRAARPSQGSIACLTGFRINLVTGVLELLAPCQAGPTWPKGYRVLGRAGFTDAQDFRGVLQRMMDRTMPPAPRPDQGLKFRDDLLYRPQAHGFDLVSPRQIHHLEDTAFNGRKATDDCGDMTMSAFMGQCIAAGTTTWSGLQKLLAARYGLHPFLAFAAIRKLFDAGLLDECFAAESETESQTDLGRAASPSSPELHAP